MIKYKLSLTQQREVVLNMLTANGNRWHYNANRFAVWTDALEHRFGKSNVSAGMIGVMILSFAVAITTFSVFSDMLTSYYGAPLIISIIAFLIAVSIPALGSFQYSVGEFWSASVHTNYSLQILLSPEILRDRKALWNHRKEIDTFLFANYGMSVSDMVELGATPGGRDSIYARRHAIQLEAEKLAEMMGHGGSEFELHMAEVNRRVYQLELEEIDQSLARLKAQREDFVGSFDKQVASYDAQIAELQKLSNMVNR